MSTPNTEPDGFEAVAYMTHKGLTYTLRADAERSGDARGVVQALRMLALALEHTIRVYDAGGVEAYRESLTRNAGGSQ